MTRTLLPIIFRLLPAAAGAIIDPTPDAIGIYFDATAHTTCATVGTAGTVDVYYLITNPTAAVRRVIGERHAEFPTGLEGPVLPGSRGLPDGCFDCIETSLYCTGWIDAQLDQTCSPPLAPVDGVVIVRKVSLTFLVPTEVEFYLRPSVYIDPDGGEHVLSPSTGDWNLPMATINGDCAVVGAESASFGGVKALYR